jgi:GntR family transcriptional regulator
VQASAPVMISKSEINVDSGASVSRQIANFFRDQVAAGKLQTGDQLPGERAVADQLGITRAVVRTAYQTLENAGLIVRQQGRPVRVRVPPPPRLMSNERYSEELERLKSGVVDPREIGFCRDYQCDWGHYTMDTRYARVPASEAHRRLLSLPQEANVLRRDLVEYVRGVPVQIRRSAIPAAITDGTKIADEWRQPWPGGTMAELWELGYTTSMVIEGVLFRPATDVEARQLGMPQGHHVIEVTRQFVVGDGARAGRVIEASDLLMPAAGNRLQYVTHI